MLLSDRTKLDPPAIAAFGYGLVFLYVTDIIDARRRHNKRSAAPRYVSDFEYSIIHN